MSQEGPPPAESEGDTGEMHRSAAGAFDRTWELELLVSGALVFTLLQLPGALDRWFWRVQPHQAGVVVQVLWFGYVYVKASVYALALAFTVHLAARAYWVGLIGLDTAFPHGAVWEKLPVGPITRRVYRDRQPSIESLIRRVDRFCNIIFPFAFSLVFLCLVSLLFAAAFGAAAAVVTSTFPHWRAPIAYLWIASAFAAPALLSAWTDRLLAGRLDASRGVGRLVYRVTGLYYTTGLGVAHRPVLNVLGSNLRGTGATVVAPLFFISMFLLVMLDVARDADALAVDGYLHLPDERALEGFDPLYYSAEHGGETFPQRRPSIQAYAIRDPFVRLFVPYSPPGHPEVMERMCPEARPLHRRTVRFGGATASPSDTAAARAVLRCLERLHPVTLNGAPVEARYRFYTEPSTGRRGVAAFIPTAPLPDTENVLTVAPVPDPDSDDPRPPHRIPFWVDRGGRGGGL